MKSNNEIQILIADDDFLICEEISRKLKQVGYQVTGFAQNGLKAVEMACSLHPNLVLMDIKMPKLNGLEASKQIQSKCQVPVVILTAYDTEDMLEKATEAGILSYLIKPPKADELDRAISVALARFNDMTELRRVKEELQISLNEKETLLKEVHHRIKNNMNVVSSLLKLQMNSIDDEKAKEALRDSRNRVQAMFMIHQALYTSDNISTINVEAYLSELGKSILQGHIARQHVSLKTDIETILMRGEQASPLGLIVNELITNSLKHAFPDNRTGEIVLKLKLNKDKKVELSVSDSGIGLSTSFDLQNQNGMGLSLVKALAENQLDGTFDTESKNGARFIITFPLDGN